MLKNCALFLSFSLFVLALAVGMGAGDSWAECPETESCSLSEISSVTVNCTNGKFDFLTRAQWAVPTNPVPIVIIQPNSAGGTINVVGDAASYDPSFATSEGCVETDFQISVEGFLDNKAQDGVVNSELVVNPTIMECYTSDETFIPGCD